MNKRLKKVSSAIVLGFAFSVPFIQGCASQSDETRVSAAVDDKQFMAWFDNLTSQIKADPTYKRIPIETQAQQNEFLGWLHAAYRKQITKNELTHRINSKYPNHESEAAFIASKLPSTLPKP